MSLIVYTVIITVTGWYPVQGTYKNTRKIQTNNWTDSQISSTW